MEAPAGQSELFSDYPVIEAHTAKRSLLRQLLDATEKHGPLLPKSIVESELKVSRQRVAELVAAGRLAAVEAGGRTWVPAAALEFYLAEGPRKSGPRAKAA
jgi:hypothetical protein